MRDVFVGRRVKGIGVFVIKVDFIPRVADRELNSLCCLRAIEVVGKGVNPALRHAGSLAEHGGNGLQDSRVSHVKRHAARLGGLFKVVRNSHEWYTFRIAQFEALHVLFIEC